VGWSDETTSRDQASIDICLTEGDIIPNMIAYASRDCISHITRGWMVEIAARGIGMEPNLSLPLWAYALAALQ